MGSVLGVHYYNKENDLLLLKWNETDNIEKGYSNEEFKFFIAPYIKDTKLTCLIDDTKGMIKYSFYDEGKKMIEPILNLPVGDEDCITLRERKFMRIALHATLETFEYSTCEYSFKILEHACEILIKNGIVPKDIREYFEILNNFDFRFISESQLPEEEQHKVLEIMSSCPNEKDIFLQRAHSEQEYLQGENQERAELPYIYVKK